jgi:DNA-directed RNA polymerase III subunit RPC3
MAHYYLGDVTASVFGALLRSLEKIELKAKVKPERYKKEEDSDDEDDWLPCSTDIEVLEHLDKGTDLAQGVKVPKSSSNLPNGVSKRKVISDDPDEAELGIKVEKESDDEEEDEGPPVNGYRSIKERNKRLALVGMHLNILAEHKKRFVKRSWDSKASRVDIAALTTRLVQDEVDTMIGNRYSNVETRIVRCLRERGKLEEKSVQSMTMMRLMPLRMHLTFLQFAGICDSQEIPKDASRQPNRVLHLWQFNEKRVVNQYLHRAYQGMSRTLQRLRVEREGKFKAVIEKAERVDVKGREQELLNLQEKNLLKEWREVEERLLVQVDRLDDLVGVLRDFPGGNTSLIHH